MTDSAIVAVNLRGSRIALGVSQSRLARLSGVSRFRICAFELGDGSLSPDAQNRIREALRTEAGRLRSISDQIDLDQAQPGPELSFEHGADLAERARD
jgi:transcriptional regulator with XRE-family HTH domain